MSTQQPTTTDILPRHGLDNGPIYQGATHLLASPIDAWSLNTLVATLIAEQEAATQDALKQAADDQADRIKDFASRLTKLLTPRVRDQLTVAYTVDEDSNTIYATLYLGADYVVAYAVEATATNSTTWCLVPYFGASHSQTEYFIDYSGENLQHFPGAVLAWLARRRADRLAHEKWKQEHEPTAQERRHIRYPLVSISEIESDLQRRNAILVEAVVPSGSDYQRLIGKLLDWNGQYMIIEDLHGCPTLITTGPGTALKAISQAQLDEWKDSPLLDPTIPWLIRDTTPKHTEGND